MHKLNILFYWKVMSRLRCKRGRKSRSHKRHFSDAASERERADNKIAELTEELRKARSRSPSTGSGNGRLIGAAEIEEAIVTAARNHSAMQLQERNAADNLAIEVQTLRVQMQATVEEASLLRDNVSILEQGLSSSESRLNDIRDVLASVSRQRDCYASLADQAIERASSEYPLMEALERSRADSAEAEQLRKEVQELRRICAEQKQEISMLRRAEAELSRLMVLFESESRKLREMTEVKERVQSSA
jgi:hypothetical protein